MKTIGYLAVKKKKKKRDAYTRNVQIKYTPAYTDKFYKFFRKKNAYIRAYTKH